MRFSALDIKLHDRASFDCGAAALNHYLQRFAGQDIKRGLTRVYVLAEAARIIGYYSISVHAVARADMPAQLAVGAYAELPFLLLGRLAVDKTFQRQGFGDMLIAHAFKITRTAAQQIGVLGMMVEAKDEHAASFYEGFGFQRLTTATNRLVLPINAMDSALAK